MIVRYCLATLFFAGAGLGVTAIACGGTSTSSDGGVDGKADGTSPEGAVDAPKPIDAAGPFLSELNVTSGGSLLPLTPAFAPGTFDYYVRCAAATNTLSTTILPATGAEASFLSTSPSSPSAKSQTLSMTVNANQAIVAKATAGSMSNEYWVRCLPTSFPTFTMTDFTEAGTAPAAGYYILGTFVPTGGGGYTMILDSNGVPVWYSFYPGTSGVCDVESLDGGAVSFIPCNAGVGSVPDKAYFTSIGASAATTTAVMPTGVPLDLHEIRRLPNGNFIGISSPDVFDVNLTGLTVPTEDGGDPGGKKSTMNTCNLIEFTASGSVANSWQVTDHFDVVKASVNPVLGSTQGMLPDGGQVFDPIHCNSVDVDPANGNLLVSAREFDSVFYVEWPSGNVLWELGGTMASKDKGTIYVTPPSPAFNGQHDGRLLPGWSNCTGGQVSILNDNTFNTGLSSGQVYDVSLGAVDSGCGTGTPSATLAWSYTDNAAGVTSASSSTGSMRTYATSRLMGWGLQGQGPAFTEVDDGGQVQREFKFVGNQSYRAVKVPTTQFDINALRATSGVTITP